MGDWYARPDGTWDYDEQAPIIDPTPTGLFPAVQPAAKPMVTIDPDEGMRFVLEEDSGLDDIDEPDHAELEAVMPEEFPAFDTINSLMIRSIGAPDEH